MPVNLLEKLEQESGDIIAELRHHLELVLEGFVGGNLDTAPVSKILSNSKYHDVVAKYRPNLHEAFIRFLSALLYALKTSPVEVTVINDRAYDLSSAHEHLKNSVNSLKSEIGKFIDEVKEQPSAKERLAKEGVQSYENMLAMSVINKLILSSLEKNESPVRRISSGDFSSYESTTTLTVFCDDKKSRSWDLQVGDDNLETDSDRVKKYCASAVAVPFPEYGVDIVDEWWASKSTPRSDKQQQQSTTTTTATSCENITKTSVDSDQSAASSSAGGVSSECEQDCVDGTRNETGLARHITVMSSTEWEDNWLFRKKPRKKQEIFNYEPVQMVIPKPKEKGAVTLGTVDIDACSELSENNSVASLDFSSSEDDEDKPQVTGAVMKNPSEERRAKMIEQVSKDPIISKLVDKTPSLKCDSIPYVHNSSSTPSACVSITSQDINPNSNNMGSTIHVQRGSHTMTNETVAVNDKGATVVTLNVKSIPNSDGSANHIIVEPQIATAEVLIPKCVQEAKTSKSMTSSVVVSAPGSTDTTTISTNTNPVTPSPSTGPNHHHRPTAASTDRSQQSHCEPNAIQNQIIHNQEAKFNREKNTEKNDKLTNEINIDGTRCTLIGEHAVPVNTIGQIRITSNDSEIHTDTDQKHDFVINGQYTADKLEKNSGHKLTGFRAKASYDGKVVVEDITASSRLEPRASMFGIRRDSRGTPDMDRTTPLGDTNIIFEEPQSDFHRESGLRTFELVNERRNTFGSNSLRSSTSEEDLELHANVSTDYSLRRSPEGCSASAEPQNNDTPGIVRKYMSKGSPDEQGSMHSQDHGIDVTDSSLFKKNIGKNDENFDDKMKENDSIVAADVKDNECNDRHNRTVKISVCSSGLGSLSSLITTPSPIEDLRRSSPEEMSQIKESVVDTPEPPVKLERLLLTISGKHRSKSDCATAHSDPSGDGVSGQTCGSHENLDKSVCEFNDVEHCDVIDAGFTSRNEVNISDAKPTPQPSEVISLRKLRQQNYVPVDEHHQVRESITDQEKMQLREAIEDVAESEKIPAVITRPKPQPRTTILEQRRKNISKSEQDLYKCQELDRDQEIYDVVAVKCEPIPRERTSLSTTALNDDVMQRLERFQSSTLPNPKKKKALSSETPIAAKRGLAKVSSTSRRVDPFSGGSSGLIDTIPAPPSNRRNFNQVFPSYESATRPSHLVRSSSVSCGTVPESRGCESQLEKDSDDYIPVVKVRGKNFGVQIYPAVPEEVPQARYDRANVGASKDSGSEMDLCKSSSGMRQARQLSRAQSVRDIHVAPMKKSVIEEEIQGKLPSVKRLASRFLAEDASWGQAPGPGGYQSVTLPTPGRQKRMLRERQKAKKEDEVHKRLNSFDSFT